MPPLPDDLWGWRRLLAWWQTRSTLGHRAETAALRFLRRRGYRYVGRNLRSGRGEIDLILRRQGVLIFVEVRCRARGFGAADRSFDRRKRSHFARAIARYLAARGLSRHPWRADLILARPAGRGFDLAHHLGVIDQGSLDRALRDRS